MSHTLIAEIIAGSLAFMLLCLLTVAVVGGRERHEEELSDE